MTGINQGHSLIGQQSCRRDVRLECSGRRTSRPGFTLLELMIVTAILGILALLAVGQVQKSRERAIVAATKMDMKNAMKSATMFEITNGRWPVSRAEIEAVGYTRSREIIYCTFELVPGATPEETFIRMAAMHRASKTRVDMRHPLWKDFQEAPAPLCAGGA